MSFEWLLFDLDNTLLDFNQSSEQAFYTLMQARPDRYDLYKHYKLINDALWQKREKGQISADELKVKRWQELFENNGLNADASVANKEYFNIIKQRVDYVPGSVELLNRLKNNYRLMIVTNGLAEVQRPRLEISGLISLFEHIVISDEIEYAKPQAEFFEYCHRLMNNPDKNKVLVIGDTLQSDIRGAVDFGYKSCWFNHDCLANEDGPQADFVINKLEELSEILTV